MHRQCLNNKANAALQMDQWQTALRAAESALKLKMDDEKALFRKAQALEGLGRTDEALEVLDEVEQIAEDMDEDFREQILDDVKERREEIKAIEHKAAKSFNNMFKAMGDKQVFGSGRFLADGTSPPPALTGAEERQLKRIKEQDEYRAGKLKYELEQRRKEGKPLVDLPQEPEMPTPNKPPLGFRSSERTRTLTKAQAQQLLEDLMGAYSVDAFQKRVHADAKAVMFEFQPFLKRLKKTAFEVQEPLLSKWGFDPSEEGLAEMMVCLSDHTFKDPALRKLADETTKMLYGGEDGMWGMEDA